MNIDTTPKRITHVPAVIRVAEQKPIVKNYVKPQEAANRVALTKPSGNRVDISA